MGRNACACMHPTQLPIPAGGPRGGVGEGEVRCWLQVRDHQRQLLPRPFPRAPHHARCARVCLHVPAWHCSSVGCKSSCKRVYAPAAAPPPPSSCSIRTSQSCRVCVSHHSAGVLQVEAMAQLAGLVMLDPEDTEAKGLFFFGGIDSCRFRKPVVPGDVLVGASSVGGWWAGEGDLRVIDAHSLYQLHCPRHCRSYTHHQHTMWAVSRPARKYTHTTQCIQSLMPLTHSGPHGRHSALHPFHTRVHAIHR